MLKMTQLHQLESGDITVVEGVGLGSVVCVCVCLNTCDIYMFLSAPGCDRLYMLGHHK